MDDMVDHGHYNPVEYFQYQQSQQLGVNGGPPPSTSPIKRSVMSLRRRHNQRNKHGRHHKQRSSGIIYGIIHLHVGQTRDLGLRTRSDFVVGIYLDGKLIRTLPPKNGLQPTWDADVEIQWDVKTYPLFMVIKLFGSKRVSDDTLLGSVLIPIGVKKKLRQTRWCQFVSNSKAQTNIGKGYIHLDYSVTNPEGISQHEYSMFRRRCRLCAFDLPVLLDLPALPENQARATHQLQASSATNSDDPAQPSTSLAPHSTSAATVASSVEAKDDALSTITSTTTTSATSENVFVSVNEDLSKLLQNMGTPRKKRQVSTSRSATSSTSSSAHVPPNTSGSLSAPMTNLHNSSSIPNTGPIHTHSHSKLATQEQHLADIIQTKDGQRIGFMPGADEEIELWQEDVLVSLAHRQAICVIILTNYRVVIFEEEDVVKPATTCDRTQPLFRAHSNFDDEVIIDFNGNETDTDSIHEEDSADNDGDEPEWAAEDSQSCASLLQSDSTGAAHYHRRGDTVEKEGEGPAKGEGEGERRRQQRCCNESPNSLFASDDEGDLDLLTMRRRRIDDDQSDDDSQDGLFQQNRGSRQPHPHSYQDVNEPEDDLDAPFTQQPYGVPSVSHALGLTSFNMCIPLGLIKTVGVSEVELFDRRQFASHTQPTATSTPYDPSPFVPHGSDPSQSGEEATDGTNTSPSPTSDPPSPTKRLSSFSSRKGILSSILGASKTIARQPASKNSQRTSHLSAVAPSSPRSPPQMPLSSYDDVSRTSDREGFDIITDDDLVSTVGSSTQDASSQKANVHQRLQAAGKYIWQSSNRGNASSAYTITIVCRDVREVLLTFRGRNPTHYKKIKNTVQMLVKRLHAVVGLLPEDVCVRSATKGRARDWAKVPLQKEFERQGIVDSKDEGRIHEWMCTKRNAAYGLCPTYPDCLYVPRAVPVDMLEGSAKYRSKQRLPVLTWFSGLHEKRRTLVRCAQPLTGSLGKKCEDDIQLFRQMQLMSSNHEHLVIFDARSMLAAGGNHMMGKGTELPSAYSGAKVYFLYIDNIHVVRQSHEKLTDICMHATERRWLSRLEETGWLSHTRSILSGARVIARKIELIGVTAVVHCSDGWDRTAQLVSLAQMMLDPYYRTLDGFITVIEKDWLAFGHKFKDRMGMCDKKDEESPVFLQFLDCVWQMIRQQPNLFEFTPQLLLFLADHSISRWFGTFCMNSERQRKQAELATTACSVWSHVEACRQFYTNRHYVPMDSPFYPICSLKRLALWEDYFLRFDMPEQEEMEEDKERFIWVDDKHARVCRDCGLNFTTFRRKHHCRSCGHIFCDTCSKRRMFIPELGYSDKPQRVCEGCFIRATST